MVNLGFPLTTPTYSMDRVHMYLVGWPFFAPTTDLKSSATESLQKEQIQKTTPVGITSINFFLTPQISRGTA